MKKINVVPNIITAFGLSCGLFVIFKVNMVEFGASSYELLRASALLLLVAAFADLLDGAVARIIGAESEFGAMFDTLADCISFGIAPSVLFLKHLSLEQGTGLSVFALVGAILFSIGGVLRLVRFNVKAHQSKGDEAALLVQKKHFTGLPIPASALTAVSSNMILASPYADKFFPFSDKVRAVVLTCIMIVLAYFMISRWKFPSLKALHFRVSSFHLVFFTVLLAIFILYGILYFFPLVLAAVTWCYILIGWTLSIIRFIAGKKSKTLEDFEPEDHDEFD